jgi:CelD/BcsL family acetyltransferase involved in cellulose biosynthesis
VISLSTTPETGCQTVNLLHDWERLQPAWDQFVAAHTKGSVFHSSPMVRVFQAARGFTPLPLAAVAPGGEILALLVAVRVQSFSEVLGAASSRSIWYAEPLCYDDPQSKAALGLLIDAHDRAMCRRVLFAEVRPLHASGPERVALESRGYQYLDYLNFVVDVTQPKEVLWKRVRDTARASIRKSERSGLEIRHVEAPNAVDLYYPLLHATYRRSNTPLADRSLFDAAYAILKPQRMLEFTSVYDGGRPIAMNAMLLFGQHVFGWYSGSIRIPGASQMDLLQWHEIAWSCEQGYSRYDFGGAGWPNVPYGVRDFKAKFGGDLVCYGRYRKVYSRWKMALAERAYAIRKSVRQRMIRSSKADR